MTTEMYQCIETFFCLPPLSRRCCFADAQSPVAAEADRLLLISVLSSSYLLQFKSSQHKQTLMQYWFVDSKLVHDACIFICVLFKFSSECAAFAGKYRLTNHHIIRTVSFLLQQPDVMIIIAASATNFDATQYCIWQQTVDTEVHLVTSQRCLNS